MPKLLQSVLRETTLSALIVESKDMKQVNVFKSLGIQSGGQKTKIPNLQLAEEWRKEEEEEVICKEAEDVEVVDQGSVHRTLMWTPLARLKLRHQGFQTSHQNNGPL